MNKLFYFLLVLLLSCAKKDNCTAITSSVLQGEWEEVKSEETAGGFAGRTHYFTFKEDRFFLKRYQYTDAVSIDPNCNGGGWFEYVKGKFTIDDTGNQSISFVGVYSDENYIALSSTLCPAEINLGTYMMTFNNSSYCNNELLLFSENVGNWRGCIKLTKK